MSTPALTIGMGTYEDAKGVYQTVQNLGINHREAMADVEIIVVDNSPDTADGRALKQYLASIHRRWNAGARYIPMPGESSTSQPKNRVIAEAAAESVWVMDCHVFPQPGTVARVKQFHEIERRGLYHGPLIYDWLTQVETEMRPVWAGNMWGVWHRDPRGADPQGDPYPIWGHGMFCFTVRKDAWEAVDGFHPAMRGFGGEEGVIHEQFRAAGREVLCLPWFGAVHRFLNPGGPKDERRIEDIARNFVLGFQRLGKPLDDVRAHFVQPGKLSEDEWSRLVADPAAYVPLDLRPRRAKQGARSRAQADVSASEPSQATTTIDVLFQGVLDARGPLAELALPMKSLASSAARVAAIVQDWEWAPILAAGRPRELRIWHAKKDVRNALIHQAARAEVDGGGSRLAYLNTRFEPPENVPEVDLLVLDTARDGGALFEQLTQYLPKIAAKRVAICHTRGNWKKDDGSGLGDAWERFRSQYPAWHRVTHEERGVGLFLASCDPADRDRDAGPGLELHLLLKSIGITSNPSCPCITRMRQMNVWGPAECRKRLDAIVGWMREGQTAWGWASRLKATALATVTGLAFKLDILDPFPSLIEEAIRRTEEKEAAELAALPVLAAAGANDPPM